MCQKAEPPSNKPPALPLNPDLGERALARPLGSNRFFCCLSQFGREYWQYHTQSFPPACHLRKTQESAPCLGVRLRLLTRRHSEPQAPLPDVGQAPKRIHRPSPLPCQRRDSLAHFLPVCAR